IAIGIGSEGQADGYQQSPFFSISGLDASAVQFHRAFCDGESQPNISTGAVAGRAEPVKRLKDARQLRSRDSGPTVANRKLRGIQRPAQIHAYSSSDTGLSHCMADQ